MNTCEIIERLKNIAGHAVHTVGKEPFVMSLDDGIAVYEAIELLEKRDQYEKGYKEGKKDVIQRLLETDGCELCPACVHEDNYLHSGPCSKCKHSHPITGDQHYFVLKED